MLNIVLFSYNRLWSSCDLGDMHEPSSNVKSMPWSEKVFHSMLNSILALGCRFWSMSRPKEAPISAKTEENFLTRATNILGLDSTDNPSIQLVQALLLMIQYLQNRNLSNRAWVLLGMAIRVAQAVGLHMDIDGESQEQREERRKTWSLCVLLDRYRLHLIFL